MYKICFIGLGSIGKRHIKNINYVLKTRNWEFVIDAVRSVNAPLPNDIERLIRKIYFGFEELEEVYDIIFVTNPTVFHYETIKQLIPYTKHMFIEKPVFDKYEEDIESFCLNSQGVYYVACPMRYKPVLVELKKRLKNEAVYSVRAISSSYLPDWRAGTDYRQNYSAHKNMGGGVTLDLIHELDYITWLFGLPEISSHYCGKYSDLEIDSDDLSVYLLRYKDKIVEIHIDYIGRESVRNIELFCKNYVIKGDIINNRLTYIYPDRAKKEIELSSEDSYIKEMEAFLDMVNGRRKNDNDIIYANHLLKLALKND